MTATDPVQSVAEALANEGCLPGHSIHSWRCEDRERYPEPCDCVEQVAAEVIAAARPAIAAEVLREAADSLYGDERANGDHWHPLSVASWLRDRADRIEADQ